ncbi:MAG: SLC13 family permease [Anaerolineales bacterium]|nr:SLC13 family permease [Anaerolineales bacterium]
MNLEMWLVLGILLGAIILFVTEWVRLDVVAFSVVLLLMLTNVLSTEEALSGFANSAVMTIASLFVVGGGIMQTGLANRIGRQILRIAGDSELRLMVVLMLAVAFLSSFMSDTGTVAVLLPAVIMLARSAKICPSKLLIPLSFGALLGGATTLIGTTPNIIVAELLKENGLTPFQFFDFTPSGIALVLAGVIFMAFVGRHILPNRKLSIDAERFETPKELIDIYRLPDNLYRLRVRQNSKLIGKTMRVAQLGKDFSVTVLEILRPQERLIDTLFDPDNAAESPPTGKTAILIPNAETNFEAGDMLIAQGTVSEISYAAAQFNLGVQPANPKDEDMFINEEIGIAEILLPPRSSMVGKTLKDVRFGSTYHLTVLGINRPAVIGKLNIKETTLDFGDILLVQGAWKDILALREKRRDFVVMGQPEQMAGAPKREKALIALLVLLGMLILMATNLVSVAAASMLAALAMVLTGCLTMTDAYQSVDWKSLLLVAGMLPMSIALEKVGLVQLGAQALTDQLGNLGPHAILVGLFLITSAFTQVLSNTATSVLLAPIALAAAQTLGVQPYAFMMAIAIAASMAFASPVASPANTLVMGAGDYRFGDYVKVGIPMIFIALVTSMLILPLVWPF